MKALAKHTRLYNNLIEKIKFQNIFNCDNILEKLILKFLNCSIIILLLDKFNLIIKLKCLKIYLLKTVFKVRAVICYS
jgi:predicted amidophosphoribosyltransferase